MRDLDSWMYALAKAAYESGNSLEGGADNFVFVMRQVLTEAWRDGFDVKQIVADAEVKRGSEVPTDGT